MAVIAVTGDQFHVRIDTALGDKGVSQLGLKAFLQDQAPIATGPLPIAVLKGEHDDGVDDPAEVGADWPGKKFGDHRRR